MLRSLWTGASGMIAQQTNVDTISNNLANVNTVGYKKETVEFRSLLYQKLQTETTDNNGDPKPVIGQVGSGVRTGAITSRFKQGNMMATENTFDLAISGEGFFSLQLPSGEVAYTRNGSLGFSIASDGLALTNSEGYPVLDKEGSPIILSAKTDVSKLSVDENGKIFEEIQVEVEDTGTSEEGEEQPVEDENVEGEENTQGQETEKKYKTEFVEVAQLGIVQFNNPSGLEKISGSLYQVTAASGEPRMEFEDTALKRSSIRSGYLEASNVQTVDEIVNLIVAQRAYEMNSKVITASDQMLQQANNLRA
ncbi:MAG: flagellar hook-basal body protein [Lachnospiraceae bacterium]|nr:flagellar hook-basal body protein [Lachnospiraceae bacterium]